MIKRLTAADIDRIEQRFTVKRHHVGRIERITDTEAVQLIVEWKRMKGALKDISECGEMATAVILAKYALGGVLE